MYTIKTFYKIISAANITQHELYEVFYALFIYLFTVVMVTIVIDGEEEDKIAKLRDRMIKNMELCRGRISDLSK